MLCHVQGHHSINHNIIYTIPLSRTLYHLKSEKGFRENWWKGPKGQHRLHVFQVTSCFLQEIHAFRGVHGPGL